LSQPNGSQPPPQVVPPQPAPITVNVRDVKTGDGRHLLMLSISSLNGTSVYFMSKDEAMAISAMIAKAAQQMTGIVIP
jgi:hypothetical protein